MYIFYYHFYSNYSFEEIQVDKCAVCSLQGEKSYLNCWYVILVMEGWKYIPILCRKSKGNSALINLGCFKNRSRIRSDSSVFL